MSHKANFAQRSSNQPAAEANDLLLKDFSVAQRDYIVTKLYPIIKKTLVHFVTEAKNNN